MQAFPRTVILRHRKENLKKCSLRGLESREDMHFLTYPCDALPDLTGYIQLDLDAPELTEADGHRGLYLIDATWRLAGKMCDVLGEPKGVIRRSLPAACRTAYPRRQEDCSDPERGLASIEALYVAYKFLGRDTSGLLDGYHWREQFLQQFG